MGLFTIGLKLNNNIFMIMNKKILNEVNRQRQIMGLPSILLKEDTGFASIGDFFSSFVKSVVKQSEFLDDAGQALIKIGNQTIKKSEYVKLLDDLSNARYADISDEILDELSRLIRTSVDSEGVSFLTKTMDEYTAQMQKIDPDFNFDEWAKRTQRRVANGDETLDEAITSITGNNALLKKTLKEDLTIRYNKAVDEAQKLADEASQKAIDDAAEAARLAAVRDTGSIVDRIRARNPNSSLASWDKVTAIRFLYSWRWSPLTKATQWFDLGKAIEATVAQFKNRNKLMNELLDEYEEVASTIFTEQALIRTDIDAISDTFGTRLSSLKIRFDALVNYDESVEGIIKELVDLYKRNPEFSKLTETEQKQFTEEFEALLKQWNPNDPAYPTFVDNIFDTFGSVYTEQIDKFKKAVLDADGIIKREPNKLSWNRLFSWSKEKFESHIFTGTFKDKNEWFNFMKQKPYLLPAIKKLPNGGKRLIWSKYCYWWFFVKIKVPAIIGAFNVLYSMLEPIWNDEVTSFLSDADKKSWSEKIYTAFWKPFWDIMQEGFMTDKEGADGEKIPEMDPTTWDDVEQEFSLLKTLLPINLSVDFAWGEFEKIITYQYQTRANQYLNETQQTIINTADTISVELERGLDSLGIPSPTEIDITEPEIDSTLLRQQEGPVVTGPNDGRGDVIENYNNTNPNDKVTNYNRNTGEATYKGKKGKITRGGNGDLVFMSDDYQTVKNFGQ